MYQETSPLRRMPKSSDSVRWNNCRLFLVSDPHWIPRPGPLDYEIKVTVTVSTFGGMSTTRRIIPFWFDKSVVRVLVGSTQSSLEAGNWCVS